MGVYFTLLCVIGVIFVYLEFRRQTSEINAQLSAALSANQKLYWRNVDLREELEIVTLKFDKISRSLQNSRQQESFILDNIESLSKKIHVTPQNCQIPAELLFQPRPKYNDFDHSKFNQSVSDRIESIYEKFEALSKTFSRRSDQISFKSRKLKSYYILTLNGLNDIESTKCEKMPLVIPERNDVIEYPDLASVHCGAKILGHFNTYRTSSLNPLDLSERFFTSPVDFALNPSIYPGQCWPCIPPCKAKIQLCSPIKARAVSIHHISKHISPSIYGKTSAPRDFVISISNNSFSSSYDVDGPLKQTFEFSPFGLEKSDIVEIEILSNWGHPKVACIYKIEIH